VNKIQTGQIYKSGKIKFEVVKVTKVASGFSKIDMKIVNEGLLHGWFVDCGSNELDEAIECGEAVLVKGK